MQGIRLTGRANEDDRAHPPAIASMAGTRAEADLLLCCARTRVDPESAARTRLLLREEMDWDYLVRTAAQQGVLPLLYQNLSRIDPDAVSPVFLERLQDEFHNTAACNLTLAGELLQLLSLFEAHGIPAIPYKGPVLAASLYGSLLLRPFSDLDILVRRQDVRQATRLLMARGLRPRRHLSQAQEEALLCSEYARSFRRDDGSVLVELHWTIRPRYCAFRIDPECFWMRHQWVSVAGTTVRGLAPEDLLLVLCVHASWHLWGQLRWIGDVAELLRVHPGLDWGRVMEEARRLGSERMLLLGLLLAGDLLGAALPEPVLQRIRDDSAVGSLAAYVCGRLFHETDGLPLATAKMAERVFLLTMRERCWDRVGYCLHLARDVIPPSAADRAIAPLPALLFPLYYLFRPVRLAAKYGLILFRHFRRRETVTSGG